MLYLLLLLALITLQSEARPELPPIPPTVFIAPADGNDDCWESRLIREAQAEGRGLTLHLYCRVPRALAGNVPDGSVFLDLRRRP